MQRNEVTGKQSPYDGSDVAWEKACYRSKQITDGNRNECECTEVNCAGNQGNRSKVSPENTGQNTKYYEEDDVDER